MANWYGAARTNYFRVKDPEAFKRWLSDFEVVVIEKDGRYGFYSNDEYGGFPSYRHNDETGEYVDIDLANELSGHLVAGEVAVLIENGAEKLRYLSGWAQAVASDGRTVAVNLSDIYDKAKEAFGVAPTDASY